MEVIEFMYQNPFQSAKHNRFYPLCTVRVEELAPEVFTTSGGWGYAIKASIGCQNGKTAVGEVVCSPSDKYNWEHGAYKALDRALEHGGVEFADLTKKHIRKAFHQQMELVKAERAKYESSD